MLGARTERDVQVWIAGEKITYLAPQTEEAKQPVVQPTAVLEDTAIQEFVRRVLAIRELRGLLIKTIATNSSPWEKAAKREGISAAVPE